MDNLLFLTLLYQMYTFVLHFVHPLFASYVCFSSNWEKKAKYGYFRGKVWLEKRTSMVMRRTHNNVVNLFPIQTLSQSEFCVQGRSLQCVDKGCSVRERGSEKTEGDRQSYRAKLCYTDANRR